MSKTFIVSGRPPQQPKYSAPVTGPLTDSELRATPVPISGTVTATPTVVVDTPEFFEDTSFVTGDSPVTLDLNTALSRNATSVDVINDGAGNFTVAFSTDGASFGDEITVKYPERLSLKNVSIDSVRITWVSNSAYRVIAI
jgi:hypothetical protein